jgi:biopolymer transport protein ExbD
MKTGKIKKSKRPQEDFQMAPMIDMVFLLLVFFMCISTLAQADKSLELDLPKSEQSKIPEHLSDRGKISLDEQGNIYINAQEIKLEQMKAKIKNALQNNPKLNIQVRADQNTPYCEIKKVLKTCAELGAYKIIYSTEQKK